MIKLKYEGIDDWNRPVFKHTHSKMRYGSVDILFPYGEPEETVLEKVSEKHLVYFGNSFNCEPMGDNPIQELKIIKKEDILQTKFNYYSDPSHGWIKVPMELLCKLVIEKKISSYSYVNKNYVFLEEDRDAPIFIERMKEKGHIVSLTEYHTDNSSRIRSYKSYEVPKNE